MLNNKNEVVSVLPINNVNGGYVQKTYAELIEEISPDEIDKLYEGWSLVYLFLSIYKSYDFIWFLKS